MIVGGEAGVASSRPGDQRLRFLGAQEQGQRTAVLHPFDFGGALRRAGKRLVARKRKRGHIFPRSIIPSGYERRDRNDVADLKRRIGVAERRRTKRRSSGVGGQGGGGQAAGRLRSPCRDRTSETRARAAGGNGSVRRAIVRVSLTGRDRESPAEVPPLPSSLRDLTTAATSIFGSDTSAPSCSRRYPPQGLTAIVRTCSAPPALR